MSIYAISYSGPISVASVRQTGSYLGIIIIIIVIALVMLAYYMVLTGKQKDRPEKSSS